MVSLKRSVCVRACVCVLNSTHSERGMTTAAMATMGERERERYINECP